MQRGMALEYLARYTFCFEAGTELRRLHQKQYLSAAMLAEDG